MSKATGSRRRVFAKLGLPATATETQALAKLDELVAAKARRESPVHVEERERVLEDAVQAGKFDRSRMHVWRRQFDENPARARAAIAQLAPALARRESKHDEQVRAGLAAAGIRRADSSDEVGGEPGPLAAQVAAGLYVAGIGPRLPHPDPQVRNALAAAGIDTTTKEG